MMLKLGCASEPIVSSRPVLGPRPEDLQANLVRRILHVNPKLKKPADTPLNALNPRAARSFDWTRYEILYSEHVEKVERHVREIHQKLNAMPLALEVPTEVINAGRVTLVNADVSIRLQGNARLDVQEGDDDPDEKADPLDTDCVPGSGVA